MQIHKCPHLSNIYIKPFSIKHAHIDYKLELGNFGDFGDFGDFHTNCNANGRRIFTRMCSIGNLVMHFHKHDTWLWEGLIT